MATLADRSATETARVLDRRRFLQASAWGTAGLLGSCLSCRRARASERGSRPNILFAIADDWSWPYASALGAGAVSTPVFDRVAREGCLFGNAFTAAPQCSPNRAATLTGRNIWQIEEAGTHGSIFPNKFEVFPDLLESAGYHVGFTGKGWAPGDWQRGGWTRNPAGPEYNRKRLREVPTPAISRVDYAGNFESFLEDRPAAAPFCFWYGGHEPHRSYKAGSGAKLGKRIEEVEVPSFLPDDPVVRNDLLDYFVEVEWFDAQLGKMLAQLDAIGELENTIVVVTGDNGMPFPRAKANLHEYGTHVPLAIRWPARMPPGQVRDELLSFIDFAPTFLEAAGLTAPAAMTGRSFLKLLESPGDGAAKPGWDYVLTGRERHTHARFDNLGYPVRALRTPEYLYIRNFKPDRWPAGDPEGYHDIDASPSKQRVLEGRDTDARRFALAVGKRPAEELYAVNTDPGCLENLAADPQYRSVRQELRARLERLLTEQRDPRVLGTGDIFESYPRVSRMRPELGGFAERGVYNPKYAPRQ